MAILKRKEVTELNNYAMRLNVLNDQNILDVAPYMNKTILGAINTVVTVGIPKLNELSKISVPNEALNTGDGVDEVIDLQNRVEKAEGFLATIKSLFDNAADNVEDISYNQRLSILKHIKGIVNR